MDELDEYILTLETHRIKVSKVLLILVFVFIFHFSTIQLVAKLKAIFDRFDNGQLGRLGATQVEQMMMYMNKSIDDIKVIS